MIAESPHLLIKGQPGSGKTTLLKHTALSMLTAGEWKGLEGWLPVLVILSQLKGFQDRCPDLPANRTTAERLLEDYFQRSDNGLDFYTVKRFCEAGKIMFLLDGLDEIDRELRDLIAHSFADFRNHHPGCKIVLSGRPHGVDGAMVDQFGS